MIRALLIVAVVAVGAFFLLGYWSGASWRSAERSTTAVGTSGAVIDTDKARERGADLAEKAAVATEKVKEAAHEAGLTAKIKAKMALDDSVKARSIDVSTDGGSTVTLSGTVGSVAEHDRAMALARETEGVSVVIDRLKVHVP
jgi:osmotically-inducible protein OsmY